MLDEHDARSRCAVCSAQLAARLLSDGRRRVDRQAGARLRRRAHDLGHDRVRQRGAVALEFARQTNGDARPGERHAGHRHRRPRDAAASASSASATSATRRRRSARRCATTRRCSASRRRRRSISSPTTTWTRSGFPINPDPSRKLLLGWAAGPDRYENWLSNRRSTTPRSASSGNRARCRRARAARPSPTRSATAAARQRQQIRRRHGRPGFLVSGTIENGEHGCPAGRVSGRHLVRRPHLRGHTASDVPLSATGPGALQFTGTYDNTDVFLKILRSTAGSYDTAPRRHAAMPQPTAQSR